MANNGPYVSSTQVASSTPFDNATSHGFVGSDVQVALQELREHTIHILSSTATTTSGTLTLVASDKTLQILTGSAVGYTVKLPDATTLVNGQHFMIVNTTPQTVALQDGNSGALLTIAQNSMCYIYLQINSPVAGTWVGWQVLSSSIATGIINYNVVSTTAFTTSSNTDVAITSLTVTPTAGTYAIWYNATNTATQNNSLVNATVYNNGSAITDSKRTFQTGSSNATFLISGQTITSVNGSQAIDVRVSTNQGSTTVNGRSLLLIRLGT